MVYLVGALVTAVLIRNWEHKWYEKVAFCSVWPGMLLFYIIHKANGGE